MRYSEAYLEHLEHEAGRFDNEFQAAYAQSQAELQHVPVEVEGEGKFGLRVYELAYCPVTDGLLGSLLVQDLRFETSEGREKHENELDEAYCGEVTLCRYELD